MKLKRWVGNGEAGYTYWCQGCKLYHSVRTEGAKVWKFNGDMERPVFHPSVLTEWDELSPAGQEKARAFHAQHGRYPDHKELPYDVHRRCHTYVGGASGEVPGMVVFLGDCWHELRGQVLPLPDRPAPPT